jgi:hypothetical protein
MIFNIDVNRDYAVDHQELVSRNAGHLKSFDINQDGIVKLDEVVGELGEAKRTFGYNAEDETFANLMIKRQDSNRNGTIEANELFKPSEAAQGRLTSDLLVTIDTDGDKSLTMPEIATWLVKKRAK